MDPVTVAALVDAGNNVFNWMNSNIKDERSRQWAAHMWDLQNEYNLPINQRRRLEDAGINPNLAFGSSASAMGTNVPSPPSSHLTQMDVGKFWLQVKQAKANIARENAITDQMEMQNQMFALLFNDRLQTEQGRLFTERIEQGWKEDNLRKLLDLGISEKEARKDLMGAQKLYYDAMTAKTDKQREAIVQEMEHLVKKYGYEDYYYDMRVNPNETSTIMGFARAIYGPLSMLVDYLSSMF